MSRVQRQRPGQTSPLAPRVESLTVGSTPAPVPAPPTESRTRGLTDSRSSQSGESEDLPLYLRLVRKEARIREDQAADLQALRRRLVRARRDRSADPITDNTLIRVAVDLLLERAGDLQGDTEEQLRDSLR